MKKDIIILALAILCVGAAAGQGLAADEQLLQAMHDSYVKEFPQLAMLSANAVQPATPTEAVQGDLAKFVEGKVLAGEVASETAMANVLSRSVASDAENTFKSYVADPIPAAVHILRGKSIHWQGFSALLIFTADEKTFDDLKLGYDRIPFERLKPQAQEWFGEEIAANPDIQCYFRNDNKNKYYLIWDSVSGKVFFKGIEG